MNASTLCVRFFPPALNVSFFLGRVKSAKLLRLLPTANWVSVDILGKSETAALFVVLVSLRALLFVFLEPDILQLGPKL